MQVTEFTMPEKVKNKEQARDIAIDWQTWSGEVAMSYGELSMWQDYFRELADKFHLVREFKENGII